MFLVLKAYLSFIYFDFLLSSHDFAAVHRTVRNYRTRQTAPVSGTRERVCQAVDIAAIWYWKQVSCLHRSAVATCLLRNRGVNAQLVIGAQQLPFKSHAWVEADRQVVNDKPYVTEMYAVLDRC